MGTLIDPKRSFRANLAVGQKLAFGFGLVGVVSLLLVAVTFFSIDRLDVVNESGDITVGEVDAASRVQHWAAVMRAEQLSYVASEAADRTAFESASSNFEAALDELRRFVSSPAAVALTRKISSDYQTFLVLDQFVWQAKIDGNFSGANELTLGAAALDFGFIASDADRIAAISIAEQAQTRIDFADTRDRTRVVVGAFGVLALVLVAGASRGITTMIRDPLLEVQLAAVQAAGGDLEAVAPVRGSDEIGTLATAFNSMLSQLRMRETKLIKEYERGELSRQIDQALEMTDSEMAVHGFVARALNEIAPFRSTELLLADDSRSSFSQVAVAGPASEGPGCQVDSPYSCPAIRAARVTNFDNSEALDSCLHLAGRPTGACSASCLPVSFMGRAVGVLHSTGIQGEPIEEEVAAKLEMLARSAGSRLGVIRSTAKTEHRANTDGLTSLPNRRSFEAKARAMHSSGVQYTLVMADLDHFKLLNDSYGHAAGDQALKTFSDVLQATVRENDIVSRWGGEEFTIALVNSSPEDSVTMLERLRVELSGRIATSDTKPFTASFGYIDATACESFDVAIRLADEALYEAKDGGRDRAVAANPSTELVSSLEMGAEEPDYDSSHSSATI